MRRLVLPVMLALAACSTAPGRGGDEEATMGARARKAHGADPVAAPPADVGNAEDPVGVPKR